MMLVQVIQQHGSGILEIALAQPKKIHPQYLLVRALIPLPLQHQIVQVPIQKQVLHILL